MGVRKPKKNQTEEPKKKQRKRDDNVVVNNFLHSYGQMMAYVARVEDMADKASLENAGDLLELIKEAQDHIENVQGRARMLRNKIFMQVALDHAQEQKVAVDESWKKAIGVLRD